MALILERVAKQPASGSGTMPIVHPPGVHEVYLELPPGVFDLIVTWPGRARVEAIHLPTRKWEVQRRVVDFPAQSEIRERRALCRIASEVTQWVFFRSTGALDENSRLAAQVIPANLTLDA